jgi:hypothetical protein
MNRKNYLLVLLLLFCLDTVAYSQLIYEYSPTGNRKRCYVGLAKISATPDKQEEYTEILDDIQFTIYPNPTKGLMKVSIETDAKIDALKIELYDINGKQIIMKSIKSKELELDITETLSGSYFMKVFVNNKPYYWNILKE